MTLELQTLHQALEAVKQYCGEQNLSQKDCFHLNLVCEELVVNLLRYTGTDRFGLSLHPAGNATEMMIRYKGGQFDPTRPQKPRQKSVEEMQYGGLGLVLVNALASEIEYHYDKKQSQNVIKIIL